MKVYPCRNADASPVAYTIEPADHHAALVDAESHGWKLGGVFHSHPKGKATMSATDLDKANEPDWLYVVVGLGGPLPELTVNSVT